MEELTTQKVNKWLFWIMIGFFIIITYVNFQEIVHQIILLFLNIPTWFLLISTLLLTFLIINLLHLGDRKIKEMEENLSEKQNQLMNMECKVRLITQDMSQITLVGFKYYCADVLKVKGYHEIKVKNNKEDIDIEAKNPQGKTIYIKCFYDSLTNTREQIHQLYYKMLQDGIENGIVLSNIPFTQEDENWASTFKIEYLDGKKINELTQDLLEVDMTPLASWF